VSRIVHFQLKLGIINKELFYIPKHLEDRFDGIHVWLKITEEETKHYSQNLHYDHYNFLLIRYFLTLSGYDMQFYLINNFYSQ